MDIYILRDGKETGPFSEQTAQTLLAQGGVRESDYAWHAGLPKWIPLSEVLNPSALALETPPPPPPSAAVAPAPIASAPVDLPKAGESATEKQKALLSYLGIAYSPETTKDQASVLINDAMEEAKNAPRLAQWNTDRLKLHPELFAAEIQAKKENRASDYFEICQVEGAEYFTKITKAHCQVLVGYLDVKFPNWDTEEKEAAKKYFFPAVAEKFPQLVAKPWKGKLRYATGPKVAAELSRQRPATGKLRSRRKAAASPLTAIARGLVFGLLILGLFFVVQKVLNASGSKTPAESPPAKPSLSTLPPIPEADVPTNAQAAAGEPRTIPATPALNESNPEPAKVMEIPKREVIAMREEGLPIQDPGMAAETAPQKSPAPVTAFPPDPPMTAGSLFSPEPAVPPAPAPATATPITPVPSAPPPVTADPAATPRINLKLTKPFDVQLAYGKMKLPVGTPVKLISREGNMVKVNYLNTVLTVPAGFTDIGAADAAPAPVPAAAPVTPPAATPPAAPSPAADL